MPPDPTPGSGPLRRCAVIVVLSLVLLVAVPGATGASDAPAPRAAPTSSHLGGPLAGTSRRTTTSTSRPPQQTSADPSSPVLPLVVAALLFLALLVPTTSYHSHGHWHPR
jgi:hypothetical protein